MQNGLGIPLPHPFRMQTHRAVLEKIRLSDLTRRYYRNIIYKLPFTELFDTDR